MKRDLFHLAEAAGTFARERGQVDVCIATSSGSQYRAVVRPSHASSITLVQHEGTTLVELAGARTNVLRLMEAYTDVRTRRVVLTVVGRDADHKPTVVRMKTSRVKEVIAL